MSTWIAVWLVALSTTAFAQCSSIVIHSQKSKICQFNSAVFTATGVPAGSQYLWIFNGDSIRGSRLDTVSFIANKTGVFDVKLEVKLSDQKTCIQNITNAVQVGAIPGKIPITVDLSTVCILPTTVSLKANTADNLSFEWIISHNGKANEADDKFYKSNAKTINHTITTPGYKTVVLRAVNANGCDAVYTLDSFLYAFHMPTPAFSIITNKAACEKKTVSFKPGFDIPDGVNFLWEFESGFPTTSNDQAPGKIIYAKEGDYDVSLTLTSQGGCKSKLTKPDSIQVGKKKDIQFSVSKETCTGQPVEIKARINGGQPDGDYYWTISGGKEDEEHSTAANKVVTYSKGGSYDIALRYLYGGCASEASLKDTVKIKELTAAFTSDHFCNCAADTFLFTNTTKRPKGEKIDFLWQVEETGTGIPLASKSSENLSYYFSSEGSYMVKLTAKNAMGCQSTYQKPVKLSPLMGSISVSKKAYCLGEETSIKMNQNTTCNYLLDSVKWILYDQNGVDILFTTDEKTVKYTYDKVGKYKVALLLENGSGCMDTLVLEDAVEVYSMKISYSINTENICVGDEVKLAIEYDPFPMKGKTSWFITNPITKARYTAFEDKVSFSFLDGGVYSLSLSSMLTPGCKDSIFIDSAFRVSGAKANPVSLITESCLPLNDEVEAKTIYNYHYRNTSDALQYQWTTKAGTGFTIEKPKEQSTKIAIDKSGFYDLTLTLTNSDGCVTTQEFADYYAAGVISDFSMPPIACVSVPFALNNLSDINPISYRWKTSSPSLAIKPKSTARYPDITAQTPGIYTIQLITENNVGCVDSITKTVEIIDFQYDFESPDTNGICSPAFVRFFATAVNVDSFIWIFGDGRMLRTTEDTVSHLYNIQGLTLNDDHAFDVILVAVSKFGCYDTLIRKSYIRVWGPQPKFLIKNPVGTGTVTTEFINLSKGVSRFYFSYGDLSSVDSNFINQHTYKLNRPNLPYNSYHPYIVAFDDRECMAIYHPSDSIVVYNTPMPGFSADTLESCDSIEVQFFNESLYATQFEWFITGIDTAFSTDPNPSIKLYSGNYSVKLIAYNPVGDKKSMEKIAYIHVYDAPVVDISLTDTFACMGKDLTLFDRSTSKNAIARWDWTVFAKGGIRINATDQNPLVQFTQNGIYSIDLMVTDKTGCSAEKTFADRIKIGFPQAIKHGGLTAVSFHDNNTLEISWSDENSQGVKQFVLWEETFGKSIQPRLIGVEKDAELIPATYSKGFKNDSSLYYLTAINQCGDTSFIGNKHRPVKLYQEFSPDSYLPRFNWNCYLGWSALDKYEIWRTENGGKEKKIGEVSSDKQEFIDSFVCKGTYHYRIKSIGDDISWSNAVTVVPNYSKPVGKVDVVSTTVLENGKTMTIWDKTTIDGFTQYMVSRNDPGFGMVISYGYTKDSFFVDDDVYTALNPYTYHVAAVDYCYEQTQLGEKGNSIVLKAYRTGMDAALVWNKYRFWPSGTVNYTIERKLAYETDFRPIFNAGSVDTNFVDEGIFEKADDVIEYRIKADQGEKQSISNRSALLPEARIFFANAFTPNKDGLNDRYRVYGSAVEEWAAEDADFELTIFNQWGEIVYRATKLYEGWDGSFAGADCPADVYFYMAQIQDLTGKIYSFKGNITLIR